MGPQADPSNASGASGGGGRGPSNASGGAGADSGGGAAAAGGAAAGSDCFDCAICMDKAAEPVVTQCGHLFCWGCLSQWLDRGENSCPVCKAGCSKESLIPLYGSGRAGAAPAAGGDGPAPPRPQARRPPTPPPRRRGWEDGGVQFYFGFPFFGMMFPGPGADGPWLQMPEWNDETKSKLWLYAGLMILFVLFILEV
eukprot:TRINITY_DN24281_c0_g4_i1.p1 TRINITY_DN24281_c0_g4~~TRINITY_DN24281_c0_g4_i1.p1  ORF type:complete len:197 (+),score=54.17 TRINITY_DN24281_c0_g4_i1:122-712(+)